MVSLAIFSFFGFLVWCRGPGYISKDPEVSMTDILELFQPHEICFECETISIPRSHHCNVCKKCVERYDHHCPWLNSCIGTRNHGLFLVFSIFQTIYILAIVVQIIGFYVTFARPNDDLMVHTVEGKLVNTCRDPELTHFTDWCTDAMSNDDGFFSGN